MSNIFVIHFNSQKYLKQSIRLSANIYQYKVDDINLPNNSLCMEL